MNVLCLCPTYGRPRVVANAVACYLAQDYPEASRKLLILDDAGQIESQDHAGWQVISTPERFPSLPAKYNAMLTAEGVMRRRREAASSVPSSATAATVAASSGSIFTLVMLMLRKESSLVLLKRRA